MVNVCGRVTPRIVIWPLTVASRGPALVTLSSVTVTGYAEGIVDLRLDCSSGFYVRSLAHDLGSHLAIGAHLLSLRRTRSGSATLAASHPLAALELDRAAALAAIVPMARLLPSLPELVLTDAGAARTIHGCTLGAADFDSDVDLLAATASGTFRLVSRTGSLLAVARTTDRSGFLHPSVVLV